jgi:hypothetical protein
LRDRGENAVSMEAYSAAKCGRSTKQQEPNGFEDEGVVGEGSRWATGGVGDEVDDGASGRRATSLNRIESEEARAPWRRACIKAVGPRTLSPRATTAV